MADKATKYRRKFRVSETEPRYIIGTHQLHINGKIHLPGTIITGEIPHFYIDNGHVTPVKGE